MATMTATLLRAARNASRAAAAAARAAAVAAAASRSAAMASRSARSTGSAGVAASRSAAMASRSARSAGSAGVAATAARAARLDSGVISPPTSCPTRDEASTKPRDDALRRTSSCADYFARLSDDGLIPMDKDMESDEAIWALYERWCKTFNKKRDKVEMARRFKLFKYYAHYVHNWNTCVPEDPKAADLYRRKRRQVELRLIKGKDISHIREVYRPLQLAIYADGRDPVFSEYEKKLLKEIEEGELKEIEEGEL